MRKAMYLLPPRFRRLPAYCALAVLFWLLCLIAAPLLTHTQRAEMAIFYLAHGLLGAMMLTLAFFYRPRPLRVGMLLLALGMLVNIVLLRGYASLYLSAAQPPDGYRPVSYPWGAAQCLLYAAGFILIVKSRQTSVWTRVFAVCAMLSSILSGFAYRVYAEWQYPSRMMLLPAAPHTATLIALWLPWLFFFASLARLRARETPGM